MEVDPEQHMIIVKSRDEWGAQGRQALAELVLAGFESGMTLGEAQPLNPKAFSALIEAMYALSDGNVDDELVRLAGLKPVDQQLDE